MNFQDRQKSIDCTKNTGDNWCGKMNFPKFFSFFKKKNVFFSPQPPLFLKRNLTYINYKKCRVKKGKRRSSGKFCALHTIVEKLAEQRRGEKVFMTLSIAGFFCDEIMKERYAEVQIFHKESLTKVSHRKILYVHYLFVSKN